jgi:TIR domain
MSEAGRKKTSQLQPSLAAGGRPSGIFISHATADKELVDALVDLLQTGIGVPHDQIFCTSLEGHGIPEGEDFADFIRDKLQGAGHVIMVITPRYYESAFCLCELGATWIQSGSAFPLIVPPLGFSDMKAVLSGVQAGLINDASKLDNLRDRLGSSVPTAKWNAKRDVFLRTFDQRLAGSIKGPTKIPSEKFKELNEKYAALLDEVSVKENEIRTLNQQIADLKALRDRSEVAKVVAKYSDEEERFDALIKRVQTVWLRAWHVHAASGN